MVTGGEGMEKYRQLVNSVMNKGFGDAMDSLTDEPKVIDISVGPSSKLFRWTGSSDDVDKRKPDLTSTCDRLRRLKEEALKAASPLFPSLIFLQGSMPLNLNDLECIKMLDFASLNPKTTNVYLHGIAEDTSRHRDLLGPYFRNWITTLLHTDPDTSEPAQREDAEGVLEVAINRELFPEPRCMKGLLYLSTTCQDVTVEACYTAYREDVARSLGMELFPESYLKIEPEEDKSSTARMETTEELTTPVKKVKSLSNSSPKSEPKALTVPTYIFAIVASSFFVLIVILLFALLKYRRRKIPAEIEKPESSRATSTTYAPLLTEDLTRRTESTMATETDVSQSTQAETILSAKKQAAMETLQPKTSPVPTQALTRLSKTASESRESVGTRESRESIGTRESRTVSPSSSPTPSSSPAHWVASVEAAKRSSGRKLGLQTVPVRLKHPAPVPGGIKRVQSRTASPSFTRTSTRGSRTVSQSRSPTPSSSPTHRKPSVGAAKRTSGRKLGLKKSIPVRKKRPVPAVGGAKKSPLKRKDAAQKGASKDKDPKEALGSNKTEGTQPATQSMIDKDTKANKKTQITDRETPKNLTDGAAKKATVTETGRSQKTQTERSDRVKPIESPSPVSPTPLPPGASERSLSLSGMTQTDEGSRRKFVDMKTEGSGFSAETQLDTVMKTPSEVLRILGPKPKTVSTKDILGEEPELEQKPPTTTTDTKPKVTPAVKKTSEPRQKKRMRKSVPKPLGQAVKRKSAQKGASKIPSPVKGKPSTVSKTRKSVGPGASQKPMVKTGAKKASTPGSNRKKPAKPVAKEKPVGQSTVQKPAAPPASRKPIVATTKPKPTMNKQSPKSAKPSPSAKPGAPKRKSAGKLTGTAAKSVKKPSAGKKLTSPRAKKKSTSPATKPAVATKAKKTPAKPSPPKPDQPSEVPTKPDPQIPVEPAKATIPEQEQAEIGSALTQKDEESRLKSEKKDAA